MRIQEPECLAGLVNFKANPTIRACQSKRCAEFVVGGFGKFELNPFPLREILGSLAGPTRNEPRTGWGGWLRDKVGKPPNVSFAAAKGYERGLEPYNMAATGRRHDQAHRLHERRNPLRRDAHRLIIQHNRQRSGNVPRRQVDFEMGDIRGDVGFPGRDPLNLDRRPPVSTRKRKQTHEGQQKARPSGTAENYAAPTRRRSTAARRLQQGSEPHDRSHLQGHSTFLRLRSRLTQYFGYE